MSPFVVPVLVYAEEETCATNWLTGGTAFFAKTREGRFLATANHVVEEIDVLRSKQKILVFLGGNSCAPHEISEWSILDRDANVDICTLKVPTEFKADTLKKKFFELQNWPHSRAQISDKAFVIGYPAAYRTGTPRSVSAGKCVLNDFGTDVGPRRFLLADHTDERQVLLNPDERELPEHFGGMSGAPVFRMIENAPPDFIGIFSGGSDGVRGAFFCAHGNFILPSGLLDRGLLPP